MEELRTLAQCYIRHQLSNFIKILEQRFGVLDFISTPSYFDLKFSELNIKMETGKS